MESRRTATIVLGREGMGDNAAGTGVRRRGGIVSRATVDQLAYMVPDYAQGQIVTQSYAESGRYLYQRCFDGESRRVTYYRAPNRCAPRSTLPWEPVAPTTRACR